MRYDRGSELRVDFQQYMAENSIKLEYCSVNYPQANGQAEAAVKLAKHALRQKIAEDPTIWWDLALPSILAGLRFSTSTTTGFTPAEILNK